MSTPYHAAESAAKLCAALADAPGPAKALDALIAAALCERHRPEDGESAEPRWLVDGRPLAEPELPYWSGDLAAAAGWLRQRYPGWAWRLRNGRFRPGRPARPFASFHDLDSGEAVIGPPCHTEPLALLAAGLCVETLPLRFALAAGLYALDNPDRGQVLQGAGERLLVEGYLRLDGAGGATATLRRRHGDGGQSDESHAGRYRVPAVGLVAIEWQGGPREAFQGDGGLAGPSAVLTRTGTTAPGPHHEGSIRFRRIGDG